VVDRVHNFARAISSLSAQDDDKIAIAAAFHDLFVRGGIPRVLRRAADSEFPVTDFVPKAVARLTIGWLPRHPLHPAPVFRGGAALRRTGRT
jgi:hypothetical protein